MDQVHSTTELRKGKHLSWTPNRIAGELGCAPNTVRNEIKRGTVTLYRGNIFRYKAKIGQAAYEKNREACCRHYNLLEKSAFISYVEEHFFEDEWSLDVCARCALKDRSFTRAQIVCTKTLYGSSGKAASLTQNSTSSRKQASSGQKHRGTASQHRRSYGVRTLGGGPGHRVKKR